MEDNSGVDHEIIDTNDQEEDEGSSWEDSCAALLHLFDSSPDTENRIHDT